MKIQDLMTKSVVTIDLDEPLEQVKRIFDESAFHHLLVVENGILCGIVSDRDLFKSISPNVDKAGATNRDLATLNKRVHQIMSRRPITLPPEASVKEAVRLFNEHKISCIPVINTQQKPIGIVSWRDIIKELAKRSEAREQREARG